MRKFCFVVICLFSAGLGYSQEEGCDLSKLQRLGELYRDTTNTTATLIDDPEDENFGKLMDTTRTMALVIIRDDYFSTCLKGKKKRAIKKVLGKNYEINKAKKGNYESYYFCMVYGGYCEGICGYTEIAFDEKGRAKRMSVISF